MPVNEQLFDDRDALFDALRQEIVARLEAALEGRGHATLLLSGGSTPAPLYRALSGQPLDWAAIEVALVDERWVDSDHPASNERLLRQTLLADRAAAARLTGMKNNHSTPFTGEAACNQAYAALRTPFDLALLGMGPDGHTASLFPGARGLEAALDRQLHCAAIQAVQTNVTGEHVERMTMTPWGLLQSRCLMLLITGDEKLRVYRQALREGADSLLPIGILLDQPEVPVEVYWAP